MRVVMFICLLGRDKLKVEDGIFGILSYCTDRIIGFHHFNLAPEFKFGRLEWNYKLKPVLTDNK